MKSSLTRSPYLSAAKVLAAIGSAIMFCPFALLGVFIALNDMLDAFSDHPILSFGVTEFAFLMLGGGGLAGTLALALSELLSQSWLSRTWVRIGLAVALLWGASSGLVLATWVLSYPPVEIRHWIGFISLVVLALLGLHSIVALRIAPR